MSTPRGNSALLALLLVLQLVTMLGLGASTWFLHSQMQVIAKKAASVGGGGGKAPSEPEEPKQVDNWRDMIRSSNFVLGPADAPVTMIEFSDFQCPFCRRHLVNTRRPLLEQYKGKLRFVFKHMPLAAIHPQAVDAAVAAQCALREGKFLELHDKMFDAQRELAKDNVLKMARSIGLGSSFEKCFLSAETRAEVERDERDAEAAGVRGTPSFIINGKFISGAQPITAFKAEIDKML